MPQLEQIATFPSQIFWLVMSFLTLFIIMWRIAVPKIVYALEARQERIDNNLERAAELKKEAEITIDNYERSLAKAHSDAQEILAEANSRLSEIIAAREADLVKNLQTKITESEENIATAVNAAAETLRDVAIEATLNATERLIGEPPSHEDVQTAIENAIAARG
ncbi:MAG: hypothetical protein CMF69_11870 [Magnetovibrio sp.]|nr:hypothetical protein [Magnetovibrio sp.]|tara:strand:- start:455 stop:949 length:495 start_codon:yes stop_codon:yes gene_type:complete